MFSDFGDSQSCDLICRCTVMKLSFAVDQIAIRLSTLSRGYLVCISIQQIEGFNNLF